MIWHTIDQAADVMGLTPRTIRKWIAAGDLPVKSSPILPGIIYIDDADLKATEAAVAARRGGATKFTHISTYPQVSAADYRTVLQSRSGSSHG